MVNKFVCCLLLLIAASSTDAASTTTDSSAHSYLASILDEYGYPICAGVLVKKNIVVTAASCLNFYNPDKLVVVVKNGTQIIQISAYAFNPNFDFTTMDSDVAVIKLAESVDAQYITLASKQRPTGASGVLIGWYSSNYVVEVDETIISAEDCVSGKYNFKEGDLFDTMLCGLAQPGACGFLPGSPLLSHNHLVGLASWGNGCGNKGFPAVYTDIASFISWIKSTEKSL
ncbi:PREDICTED: trypsin-like [Rhagoletis zephyria]|uniref:trypsin-like n=1 Tax=Rhagoletis zephyria TaxID=28612 RepID=UPI00081154A9|nr:PREDICTED: trypsin-like [Rhagoletis zephyria]